jgi:hypothetical protein
VPNTTGSNDPIDSLRVLYDAWKELQKAHPDSSVLVASSIALEAGSTDSAIITVIPLNGKGATPVRFDSVTIGNSGGGTLSPLTDNGDGSYTATLTASVSWGVDTMSAGVGSYGDFTGLNSQPVITYYACGNADNIVGVGGPVDIADLTYLVAYLFQSGPPPPIIDAANMDGIVGVGGPIDVADLTYLVAFLFNSGPAPVC